MVWDGGGRKVPPSLLIVGAKGPTVRLLRITITYVGTGGGRIAARPVGRSSLYDFFGHSGTFLLSTTAKGVGVGLV